VRPQILAAASVLIAHPDLGGLDPRGAVVGWLAEQEVSSC